MTDKHASGSARQISGSPIVPYQEIAPYTQRRNEPSISFGKLDNQYGK